MSQAEKRLVEMLEEAAHLIMAADEREADLILGSPVQDALGQSRANFPQARLQLGQAKAPWQLFSRQSPDEQIDPAFNFQLLDGIEAPEAAGEGRIEAVAHSQAPEVPQGGLLRTEGLGACAALGQASQGGELFLGERRVRDDGGLRDHHSTRLDEEPDGATFGAQTEGLPDRLRQAHLPVGVYFCRNERLSHRLRSLLRFACKDSSHGARRQGTIAWRSSG